MHVDLDSTEGAVAARPGYEHAWLVGWRAGVPQVITELERVDSDSVDRGVRALQESAGSMTAAAAAVPDDRLPRISVVVPTVVQRVADLAACLDELGRVDYPDFEVVLVDNRPVLPLDDPLPGLLAGRPGVRAVRESTPGISAARNAGTATATGSVVAFTDDDVRVDRRWLRALGTRFATHSEVVAVGGLILPAELETPAQIYFERFYGGFGGVRSYRPAVLSTGRGLRGRATVEVRDEGGEHLSSFALYGAGAYAAGANMAFHRSTLLAMGGFDPALGTGTPSRGGEDLAAVMIVLWDGGAVAYEPGAVVFHKHREQYDQLVHQLRGNGLGFTAMLTSLVTHDPRHLVGLGLLLPLAVRRMGAQTLGRLRRRPQPPAPDLASVPVVPASTHGYPRGLVAHELLGMPQGPLAYLRSRRRLRPRHAAHDPDAVRL
ncbi:MAG: hypothetical protein JWP61_1681 [Friedmanniella sp.]|nr:hypothetical protein [Friedmanniella sp.]